MRQKIGILGATGMVGQRFIQLLENHPWFEVAWLAASDRSSGKPYGEAVRWKLDTPLPERIAACRFRRRRPDGRAEGDFCRARRRHCARAGAEVCRRRMRGDFELERVSHGAVGAAGDSGGERGSSGADGEPERGGKKSGGYIVTNPNCSAIGLVMALKPIVERFGIEAIFVSTMQAVSGAGYPGVASLDILGNVVPYIKNEEEKMEAGDAEAAGPAERPRGRAAGREDDARTAIAWRWKTGTRKA